MKNAILLSLVFTLVVVSNCFALERFDIITTEELVQMLDARKRGEVDFLLVNTLDEILARNKSIPGSISVPWSRIKTAYERLGDDKDRLIIAYCMGYR